MDYNNDGIQDMISGSYDPGSIYLFKGLGKGKYDTRIELTDEKELPLVHSPSGMQNVVNLRKKATDGLDKKAVQQRKLRISQNRLSSFASWPTMVDFENDGDLDMLIGTFGGNIGLRKNIGTRSEPVFDKDITFLDSDGKRISTGGHACPVAADWDNDGIWDLVVSSEKGLVAWYPNTGKATEPKFGRRKILFRGPKTPFFGPPHTTLKPDETPRPGRRVQICVTDYNNDGKLDLVMGDYAEITQLKPLDEDQEQELESLLKREKVLKKTVTNVSGGYVYSRKPFDDKEKESQYQTKFEELKKLIKKKNGFYQHNGETSFVWVLLRK